MLDDNTDINNHTTNPDLSRTPNHPTTPSADPTPPSNSAPAKPAKFKHPVLDIIGAIVVAALFIGGGILAGMLLKPNPTPSDAVINDSTSAKLFGEVTVPAENVALIPESDRLTLSFLQLHNDSVNSCYSPLSIRYALEMLQTGADGDTKSQIDQLLGDTAAKRYENIPDHLSVANSLWVKDGLQDHILPSFTTTLKDKLNADLKVDSFQSAANINTWAKDNTFGLIDQPLSDEDVHGLTAALINVLAIDMNWAHEFDKLSTFGGYFNFTDDTDLEEDKYTMLHDYAYHNIDDYAYNFAKDATLLAKDLKEYNGTHLQFVAIMPDNLTEYIKNLNINDINTLLSNMSLARPKNESFDFTFEAYIPKFSIKGGLDNLSQDLKDLGITDAFDVDKANFGNMTSANGFYIDNAIHKTIFDFSEEGIKAAAITMMGGKGSAKGPGPIPNSVHIVVSISKPFLYLIRDKDSGDIWFVGTVYEPNRWNDEKAAYENK